MADDDDTSAGLTPETKATTRRRASRVAGPPAHESGEVSASSVAAPPRAASPESDAASPSGESVASGVSADASTEDTGEGGSGTPVRPARSGLRRVWAIVAAVLIVVLLGTTGWLLVKQNAADDRDAQRNAFEQTARQTVLNLTTIKPDTAKEDVDRILAGASGEFKAEFDGREDPFVGVVQEAGVTTVGKIIESGLESEDGNTAKVLVAARADVSTPDGTQNGPRDFRMRVTVTDDGGTMTASKVEFVP
ncbi:hypothetical protein [Rhodococcus gannanensis]|uniref:Mce-associated membrane protein n=1 Tax=Rhodococcus gannanensis TaxID=1960308 RepID=A0ABW4PCA7_9NOCA